MIVVKWLLNSIFGAAVFALSFGVYSASNSDTTMVYTVFLIISTLGFIFAFFLLLEHFRVILYK